MYANFFLSMLGGIALGLSAKKIFKQRLSTVFVILLSLMIAIGLSLFYRTVDNPSFDSTGSILVVTFMFAFLAKSKMLS